MPPKPKTPSHSTSISDRASRWDQLITQLQSASSLWSEQDSSQDATAAELAAKEAERKKLLKDLQQQLLELSEK